MALVDAGDESSRGRPSTRLSTRRYFAKEGCPLSNAEAEVVGAEMEEIESGGQAITKSILLARARSESSPLHRVFEKVSPGIWEDDRAAEDMRLFVARKIITSIQYEIVVTEPDNKVNRYVNVVVRVGDRKASDGRNEAVYRPLEQVLKSPEDRQTLLNQARGELDVWIRKYSTLEALIPIGEARALLRTFDLVIGKSKKQ